MVHSCLPSWKKFGAYRGGSKQTPGEGDAESDGSLEPYDLSEEEDDGRCTKNTFLFCSHAYPMWTPFVMLGECCLKEGLQHVQ
jgi:hypothetical protein